MIHYRTIDGRSTGYYALLCGLVVLVLAGLVAAHHMDVEGHHVTGMNNQIVWGTPHILAVFLILAASGALNVASIASVFGREMYKPLSRLSGLLAMTLVVGGLAILVLDLGRPDRLIVAMTYYNFKSIFAWNIFLYIGFLGVVTIYLWMMFERRMNRFSVPVGYVAFLWRLVLTTGTGSIFGFLVARQAYDAAIMGPMFIVMSLSFGTAIFLLVLMAAYGWTGRTLGETVVRRLKNVQGVFVATVLYFVLIYHLTSLYATEHHSVEWFLLVDGGVYPIIFWVVQVLIGGVIPLALLYLPAFSRSRFWVGLGAALVIIGGLGQLYVIIIGGQAYPLVMFPGMEESSSFYDGAVGEYIPSLPEIALGVGGSAFAVLLVTLALRILPFLPESLADANLDTNSRSSGVTDDTQVAQT
jgi:molybdopterin-containing oxidoreductase family membrane subunit